MADFNIETEYLQTGAVNNPCDFPSILKKIIVNVKNLPIFG